MKKWTIRTCILIILLFSVQGLHVHGKHQQMEEHIETFEVIPDEAIRLRILAHSDTDEDQEIKERIRDEVSEHITEWVEHMTDIDEARERISNGISDIQAIAQTVLDDATENQHAEVDYNDKVSFPHKLYGDFVYPAGDYEAVLITIGEGDGANWWCVLFPPLCFLDFANSMTLASSNGIDEEPVEEEIEVKFFLFEWLGWT